MFAIMYGSAELKDRVFKVFQTYDEALHNAYTLAAKGYLVTVFDYDVIKEEYLEFFTI